MQECREEFESVVFLGIFCAPKTGIHLRNWMAAQLEKKQRSCTRGWRPSESWECPETPRTIIALSYWRVLGRALNWVPIMATNAIVSQTSVEDFPVRMDAAVFLGNCKHISYIIIIFVHINVYIYICVYIWNMQARKQANKPVCSIKRLSMFY